MKKIIFPKDEKAHNNIIEWWYWNGHLKGENGRDYSFMDCLFKADSRRVKLPFLKSPFKDIYFSHSILSDITGQNFFSDIDYIDILSNQSFTRPLLFAEYIAAEPETFLDGFTVKLMKEKKPFVYRVKTKYFDLELRADKKPFLEGGDGFLDLRGRKTYYYSLTSLSAEGEIFLQNKTVRVKGQAWMDHQWADAPYAKDLWTWFSIQLKNKTELIVLEYGKNKNHYAGVCLKNGGQKHYYDVRMKPLGRGWKSSKTGAKYNLSWQIEIPEAKINLKVEPLIKNQEIIFGTINYWEGPLKVSGKVNGKRVAGRGFLELVGRPAKYGSFVGVKNILFDEAKKDLEKIFKRKQTI